jgi:hypothetical protein
MAQSDHRERQAQPVHKVKQEFKGCRENLVLLAHKVRLVPQVLTVWKALRVHKAFLVLVCDLLQESQQSTTFQPQQTKATYILSKPPATHGFGMKQSQHL